MTAEFVTVVAVVAVCSVVQSIFGMGLLIFGTPTLLLIGYDFVDIISILAPSSLTISLFQVATSGEDRAAVSRHLYFLCLPGIGLGLWIVQDGAIGSWFKFLVSTVLFVSAILRIWPTASGWVADVIRGHSVLYHVTMGIIHGLTNLGGALLIVLATSRSNEKVNIRYTIAQYYLAFGVVQIVIISTLLGHSEQLLINLPLAGISALAYLLLGNRLFLRIDNPIYQKALTLFICAYGIAVLLTN